MTTQAGELPVPRTLRCAIEVPTDSQRVLMKVLSIRFACGVYRFGPYRYDRLADALAYVRSDCDR